MQPDGTQRVWKALADPTRRDTLDLLREAPRTTGEVCAHFPHLSRFAVMKHLAVLEAAGLVIVRREGRLRRNVLNVVPIQRIYERWMRPYESAWASGLLALKRNAERAAGNAPPPAAASPRAVASPRAEPAPRREPSRSRARSPGTNPRPTPPHRKESRP